MKKIINNLPFGIAIAAALLALLHGPVTQPATYHYFADARSAYGLANASDVLSNLGFALVGVLGLLRLEPARCHPALAMGWPGYRLFLIALTLTALGSGWYHLYPNDPRLVWDRIPIALACAGLLAAVHGETRGTGTTGRNAALLAIVAVASVVWWRATGDLRPYLLMQGLPLLLVPLWQMGAASKADRLCFGLAIVLYVLAKIAELHDHEVLALTGAISGHTIKHLLATAAAAAIVLRLTNRVSNG